MPTATYEELRAETLPGRIESHEEYERILAKFGDLFNRKLTAAEDRLRGLLGVLLQEYDQRTAEIQPKSTPAELLQFLVEESGQSAAALLTPIFGQRSHVYEALNGKRPISGPQAKKLGERFCVNPGVFL